MTPTERRRTLVVWDLEGWKAIADAIERSIWWTRRMAMRPTRPLPVARLCGRVVASRARVRGWLQAETGLDGSALELD